MSGPDDHDDDVAPDAPETPAPEARAKDLVARKDPTLQELMAWFSLPPPPSDEPPPPAVDAEEAARFAEVMAAIDPRMVALSQRHYDDADRMRRPDPLPERSWSDPERMLQLDPSMGGHAATEPRELDVPYEIRAAVEQNTPQALLRDLHRPIFEFYVQYAPPWEGELDLELDPMAKVREALRISYRVGPTYTPAMLTIDATYAERRSLMKQPWAAQGARKDDWTPSVGRRR